MLKSITNKAEMKKYISNLCLLGDLVNNSFALKKNENDFIGISCLVKYSNLLKFKINNNLIPELTLDDCSGLFSFSHALGILAEKDNLKLKEQCSFKLEEIRDKLIKQINSAEDIKNFNISGTINSLANRHYLSLLKKTNISEQENIDSKLLETGVGSNLVGIVVSGYCLPLGCVSSYETDFYVYSDKLGKKKALDFDANADIHLSNYLRAKLIGFFGIPSNIIYEFIRGEKAFEPRKVKRTVFAPFYTKFFNPDENEMAELVDPYYLWCSEVVGNSNSCILSVHTDVSTKHFDAFYDEGQVEKPNIKLEHKYFTDAETAEKLKKYVPEKQIIISRK